MPQVLESAGGTVYELPGWLFCRGFEHQFGLEIVDGPTGSVLAEGPTEGPARGVLEGIIKGRRSGTQSIRDAVLVAQRALYEVLLDAPVKFRQRNRVSRYLEVYPENLDDSRTDLVHRNRLRISLLAPDPRWYGVEISSSQSRPASGDWDFPLQNAGELTVPLNLALSGAVIGAGGATIRNVSTGDELSYSAELAATASLRIYGGTRQVEEVSGAGVAVSRLAALGDSFLLTGLNLQPGVNQLEVRGVTGSAILAASWTPAWNGG